MRHMMLEMVATISAGDIEDYGIGPHGFICSAHLVVVCDSLILSENLFFVESFVYLSSVNKYY